MKRLFDRPDVHKIAFIQGDEAIVLSGVLFNNPYDIDNDIDNTVIRVDKGVISNFTSKAQNVSNEGTALDDCESPGRSKFEEELRRTIDFLKTRDRRSKERTMIFQPESSKGNIIFTGLKNSKARKMVMSAIASYQSTLQFNESITRRRTQQ